MVNVLTLTAGLGVSFPLRGRVDAHYESGYLTPLSHLSKTFVYLHPTCVRGSYSICEREKMVTFRGMQQGNIGGSYFGAYRI